MTEVTRNLTDAIQTLRFIPISLMYDVRYGMQNVWQCSKHVCQGKSDITQILQGIKNVAIFGIPMLGVLGAYITLNKFRILAQSAKTIAETTKESSHKVADRPMSFLLYGNHLNMVTEICSGWLGIYSTFKYEYPTDWKRICYGNATLYSFLYPFNTIKTVNVADIEQKDDREIWHWWRYFAGAPIGVAYDVSFILSIYFFGEYLNKREVKNRTWNDFLQRHCVVYAALLLTYPMSTISTRQKLVPDESIYSAIKSLLSKRTSWKWLALYDGVLFEFLLCCFFYRSLYRHERIKFPRSCDLWEGMISYQKHPELWGTGTYHIEMEY